MSTRTTTSRVTFFRPFKLAGMERVQPAGSYVIESDFERLDGLSFAAFRRTQTYIILPGEPGSPIMSETVSISAAELQTVLAAKLEAASTGAPPMAAVELTLDDLLAEATVQKTLSSAHRISLSHFGNWEAKIRSGS